MQREKEPLNWVLDRALWWRQGGNEVVSQETVRDVRLAVAWLRAELAKNDDVDVDNKIHEAFMCLMSDNDTQTDK